MCFVFLELLLLLLFFEYYFLLIKTKSETHPSEEDKDSTAFSKTPLHTKNSL